MNVDIKQGDRTFDLTGISEDEMRILKSLLAQGEAEAREKLAERSQYWEDRLDEDEAVALVRDLISAIDEAVRGP